MIISMRTRVKKIIKEIIKKIKYPKVNYKDFQLNERYLHHYFSHHLQHKNNSLNFIEDLKSDFYLFPEWPTYKKNIIEPGARYKNTKRSYKPCLNKGGGFIDFAVGTNYKKPEIAIEFILKKGFNRKEFEFDILKLIDPRNKFSLGIALFVSIDNNYVEKKTSGYSKREKCINNALHKARKLFFKKQRLFKKLELHFLIVEVSENKKRIWYSNGNDDFQEIKSIGKVLK